MSSPTAAPPEAVSAPAIQLRGLTRRMGSELVLKGLELEVAPSRLVILRGGNGAGKTTLLRILATRLKPTGGTARVFGFDVLKEPHEVRRHVSMLSVTGGNYPVLTALENLNLAADLAGADKSAVPELLKRVGLSGAQRKYVRAFSSGMKKRLGLARLMLIDPHLWLLDEPHSSLDEDGKLLVDEVVSLARERGRAVFMASHEATRRTLEPDAVLSLAGGLVKLASPEVVAA